jgi:hypothetical protein
MVHGTEKTRFQLVASKDFSRQLTAAQRQGIAHLVRASVGIDFLERSASEINKFGHQADRIRHNPNNGIGGPLLRRRQVYRKTHHALAIRGDEVIAHLPVADNASRRENENAVSGFLKMHGKLHLETAFGKDWIGHRYLWLGYAAMAPQVREQIQGSPENVNDMDVLIALSAARHDSRQPVSTYPWAAEEDWKTELGSIGLMPDTDFDEPVKAFGPNTGLVQQEHWTGPSIAELTEAIYAKENAEAAIMTAQAQLNR